MTGAVCGRAGQGSEQVAGLDILGTQRHAGDLHITEGFGVIRGAVWNRSGLRRQYGQLHPATVRGRSPLGIDSGIGTTSVRPQMLRDRHGRR
ncbi:hypothetical protein NIIDMKKI_28230 [Mycobacterium kansasii]|uniref:Uncharacterized protein n=1 Tax=Mycobacterium kansasii TaxID=1768 RepID=A0A7G1I9I2_MYCKA|nr:hypothetical protein NIIDMKKI_28230 [Mycobacterium kansasii]